MICGQVVIIEDWKFKLLFFIVHVILRGYFFITFYTMSFFIIPFFAIHLITTVCCNLEIMKQCLNKVDEMKKKIFLICFSSDAVRSRSCKFYRQSFILLLCYCPEADQTSTQWNLLEVNALEGNLLKVNTFLQTHI